MGSFTRICPKMSKILEALLLLFVWFPTVRSQQAVKPLPPENLSVEWTDDFLPVVRWAPPKLSMENCLYHVVRHTHSHQQRRNVTTPSFSGYTVMGGGSLTFSVQTVCNGTSSEPAVLNISYPELVQGFQCSIRSPSLTLCSWLHSSRVPDIRFFYRLTNENLQESVHDDSLAALWECPEYGGDGSTRVGCYLRGARYDQAIHVLLNATLGEVPVRNTYRIMLIDNVRLDALNWTVTEAGTKLNISWDRPNIGPLSSWEFEIRYTECNKKKVLQVVRRTSAQLDRVSHCPYRMTMRGVVFMDQETPWSEERRFDAIPDALEYTAVIIPLLLVVLAALSCVCITKHKETILPKVPKPRDLLADFSDNNNKIPLGTLYTTAKEEECQICVVEEA